MNSVYLIRHGETEWNQKGVIQGTADTPLSATGRDQVGALVPLLRAMSVFQIPLISSDAGRCKSSATILCAASGKTPTFSADLREVDFGAWTGRRIDELREAEDRRRAWDEIIPDYIWHNGESFRSAHKRANACVNKFRMANPNNDVLVVTHGFIIQLLVSWWLTGDLRAAAHLVISSGSLSIVEVSESSRIRLHGLNIVPRRCRTNEVVTPCSDNGITDNTQ